MASTTAVGSDCSDGLLANDYHSIDEDEVAHGHSHSHPMLGSSNAALVIQTSKASAAAREAAMQASAKKARCKLIGAMVFCVIFMIIEVIGGYFAKSLAILTDAAHLLSDVASFSISLFAVWLAARPPTAFATFGFHRIELFGAIASVFLIWILTGVLCYEAVQRIIEPEEVDGKIMFIVALAGVFVNIVMMKILHTGGGGGDSGGHGGHSHAGGGGGGGEGDHGHSHNVFALFKQMVAQKKKKAGGSGSSAKTHSHSHAHSHAHGGHGHDEEGGDHHEEEEEEEPAAAGKDETENINVRAAFIHALGDFIQSIGVLIASIIIWAKPSAHIVDPICTFIFSILVLFTTWSIMKSALSALLNSVPSHIKLPALARELNAIKGVSNLHDLHVWSYGTSRTALTCHLVSDFPSETLEEAQKIAKKYGIAHSTIQIERCGTDEVANCYSYNEHVGACRLTLDDVSSASSKTPSTTADAHHGHSHGGSTAGNDHGHSHGGHSHSHGSSPVDHWGHSHGSDVRLHAHATFAANHGHSHGTVCSPAPASPLISPPGLKSGSMPVVTLAGAVPSVVGVNPRTPLSLHSHAPGLPCSVDCSAASAPASAVASADNSSLSDDAKTPLLPVDVFAPSSSSSSIGGGVAVASGSGGECSEAVAELVCDACCHEPGCPRSSSFSSASSTGPAIAAVSGSGTATTTSSSAAAARRGKSLIVDRPDPSSRHVTGCGGVIATTSTTSTTTAPSSRAVSTSATVIATAAAAAAETSPRGGLTSATGTAPETFLVPTYGPPHSHGHGHGGDHDDHHGHSHGHSEEDEEHSHSHSHGHSHGGHSSSVESVTVDVPGMATEEDAADSGSSSGAGASAAISGSTTLPALAAAGFKKGGNNNKGKKGR